MGHAEPTAIPAFPWARGGSVAKTCQHAGKLLQVRTTEHEAGRRFQAGREGSKKARGVGGRGPIGDDGWSGQPLGLARWLACADRQRCQPDDLADRASMPWPIL